MNVHVNIWLSEQMLQISCGKTICWDQRVMIPVSKCGGGWRLILLNLHTNGCNIYSESQGRWRLISCHHKVRHHSVTHNQRKSPVLRPHSFPMQLSQTFQKTAMNTTWTSTKNKHMLRKCETRSWPFSLFVCVLISDLSSFAHYWLFLPLNLNRPHPPCPSI